MPHRYTILLDPHEDGAGYTDTVPALEGCVTGGATLEEAIANAKEAIAGWVEWLEKDGRTVPEEREHPPLLLVSVDVPGPAGAR